jgi:hypothetical protein
VGWVGLIPRGWFGWGASWGFEVVDGLVGLDWHVWPDVGREDGFRDGVIDAV